MKIIFIIKTDFKVQKWKIVTNEKVIFFRSYIYCNTAVNLFCFLLVYFDKKVIIWCEFIISLCALDKKTDYFDYLLSLITMSNTVHVPTPQSI